jgi:hypothetical protein
MFLSPQAGASSHLPKPASRGTSPSMLKPEDLARNFCLSGWLSYPLHTRLRSNSPTAEGIPTVKLSPCSDGSSRHSCKNKHIANEERQVFIKQKSDDYKSFLGRYPKSTKCSSPRRCSPSSAWRECCMDFVSEKPALKVDEIRPS